MQSPFPGMDPFLEEPGSWSGVHGMLIALFREQLNERLGPDFIADGGTSVYVIGPETLTVPYVLIRDRATRSVITLIELLSPINKAPVTSQARQDSLRKRQETMISTTHWVEIDLLRAGDRPAEVRGVGHYYAALKRTGATDLEVWPIGLRTLLPTIAIPLTAMHEDVGLDLQAALDLLFARYRYAQLIDYRDAPPPAFALDDRQWLAEQIERWQATRPA